MFLHHWFLGWVDAATTHVLTWSQYKILLSKKFTYLMQVHNEKLSYTVDFPHLPIWPSKPIYHLTSFRKLENLISPCNFTMQNFFEPLDEMCFNLDCWSMFSFSTQVAGWFASPIWVYARWAFRPTFFILRRILFNILIKTNFVFIKI